MLCTKSHVYVDKVSSDIEHGHIRDMTHAARKKIILETLETNGTFRQEGGWMKTYCCADDFCLRKRALWHKQKSGQQQCRV